jgi:hypothetical protein
MKVSDILLSPFFCLLCSRYFQTDFLKQRHLSISEAPLFYLSSFTCQVAGTKSGQSILLSPFFCRIRVHGLSGEA